MAALFCLQGRHSPAFFTLRLQASYQLLRIRAPKKVGSLSGDIRGLYRDNGQEDGNYYGILGLCRVK